MNGITRIQNHFRQTKSFIGYLTAGDGGIQRTLESALALINGGVNLLEIGVPFSDPIADGPVIQGAAARALAAGTTLADILFLISAIRLHSDIPLILFTYLNPLLPALTTDFLNTAQQAGLDGILIVDAPIEESHFFQQKLLDLQMAPIYVIAPSTTAPRIRTINQYGKGFLYYACRKGTTGIRAELPADFCTKMAEIKANTHLPVVAGFGIASADTAAQVLAHTDGVVVGSLFVKAVAEGLTPSDLTRLAVSINPLTR